MTAVRATILQADDLTPAIHALRAGDVVAIPTETVYGLAGNAFDVHAVTKIFSVKERPSFDPLIVHVADHLKSAALLEEAGVIDRSAMSPAMIRTFDDLARAFWPGPLTMVVPRHHQIPDLVTSGLDRVGVRMPDHKIAQALLRAVKLPLAAPSANRFGRISPTSASDVMEELGDRINFVIDGGPCDVGVESTVVALDDDRVWLLRPGMISPSKIKEVIGLPVEQTSSKHEKASPGMLASHYAPRKPLFMIEDRQSIPENLRAKTFGALIAGGDEYEALQRFSTMTQAPSEVILLSKSQDSAEAAQKLFAAMRSLDKCGCEIILATPPPSTDGLWLAIGDRLRRAATPLAK